MTSTPPAPAGGRPAALIWSWNRALAGLVCSLPAAAMCLRDPDLGIAMAVGVLPAALIPIPARRQSRIVILIVGVLAGAALFLGGVLAHLPIPLTCILLVAAVVGAAALASVRRLGAVVLSLCAPLIGAGLSYDDFATSATTFLLLSLGAVYAWLVSLVWPQRRQPERPPFSPLPLRPMVEYGLRIGIAAAIAYAIASGFDADHPGWAPAACLLVARPRRDLLQSRGIGRVLSVAAGAIVATVIVHLDPPDAGYAVIAVVVLAATAGTGGSRWYITPAFTTFFVFLMLLAGNEDESTAKFNERVGETLVGVGLAFVFAWFLPVMVERGKRARVK